MKILITGGSGLVGNALNNIKTNYLHTFKFINSSDCDLTNFQDTVTLFETELPDYVIHLAACVGGLYKNMSQKVEMLENNVSMNLNVIKCCHKYNVKKLVSCLSTCIFPDNTSYPINENMLHDGPPHFSNDAYAYAKRLLEIHSKTYREQHNSNFICVIPTNIYGPFDNYNLDDAHVIPALIHKCYIAKKETKPFVIKGSGQSLRQFIYSEDLAKLLMWVLNYYPLNDNIILSVDKEDEINIRDVVYCIAEEFDYKDNIIFETKYADGQYKKTADNSKLRQYLPNFKFTSIKKGIKKSVDWFNKNYEICRK